MSLTFSQTQGNGSTLSYPIVAKGGYFKDTDIVVELITIADGTITEQTKDTDYTIENNNVIFTVAPTSNYYVRIRRSTDNESTYSDFTRGNAFGATNLNNSFLYALYQMQQLADGFLPDDHYWKSDVNAGTRKLTNLAAGSNPQDAATKGQIDTLIGDNTENVLAAEAAQAAAEAARDAAIVSETNTEISADNAAISESNAAISAAEAQSALESIELVDPDIIALNSSHRLTTSGNPHNVTQEDIGYTAADVLTKIKTVDGPSSGLDSDKLDGKEGSYYSPIVSSISTRTTPGIWTITGITIGKPLIIGIDGNAASADFAANFYVMSGASIGRSFSSSVLFLLGAYGSSYANLRTTPSFVTIPTSTSVVLNIINLTAGAILAAYH